MIHLRLASRRCGFQDILVDALALIFVILALGTFGLIMEGSKYVGSDNLLATRNIADTNVTMAYFILLWPFALFYAANSAFPLAIISIMIALFVSIVMLSFSRGAVGIIVPYICISVFQVVGLRKTAIMVLLAVMSVLLVPVFTAVKYKEDFIYFWTLRLDGMGDNLSNMGKLWEVSGRREIQDIAWQLFTRSPMVGHGIGSFEMLGPGYREAHSLFYTLLAEQGLIGAVYIYGLFGFLIFTLIKKSKKNVQAKTLLLACLAYLVFNHTVGSVFVIIPSKSLTINCIAPMLLLCIYHYVQSPSKSSPECEKC